MGRKCESHLRPVLLWWFGGIRAGMVDNYKPTSANMNYKRVVDIARGWPIPFVSYVQFKNDIFQIEQENNENL